MRLPLKATVSEIGPAKVDNNRSRLAMTTAVSILTVIVSAVRLVAKSRRSLPLIKQTPARFRRDGSLPFDRHVVSWNRHVGACGQGVNRSGEYRGLLHIAIFLRVRYNVSAKASSG